MAKPEEAIRYYEETGVDCLAISVGTAHGMYIGEPKIQYDIIQKVSDEKLLFKKKSACSEAATKRNKQEQRIRTA